MTVHAGQELSAICQTIEQTISADQIYLFGSHAYGTPNADSDYDLCVVIPDGSMRPADAIKRIRRALFPVHWSGARRIYSTEELRKSLEEFWRQPRFD